MIDVTNEATANWKMIVRDNNGRDMSYGTYKTETEARTRATEEVAFWGRTGMNDCTIHVFPV